MKERRRTSSRSRSRVRSRDLTGPVPRPGSDLVTVQSPFPAEEDVPAHPRWWQRLRGIAGMSILVVILGGLVAVAIAVLLVLLLVAVVSTIA